MEEKHCYLRQRTANKCLPQKPYYSKRGPNFHTPDYRGVYHRGMIRKGLFEHIEDEGLANSAVLIACTLMAVEDGGRRAGKERFLIACEFPGPEPDDAVKAQLTDFEVCIRPWAIRCVLGNQSAPNEMVASISTPMEYTSVDKICCIVHRTPEHCFNSIMVQGFDPGKMIGKNPCHQPAAIACASRLGLPYLCPGAQ